LRTISTLSEDAVLVFRGSSAEELSLVMDLLILAFIFFSQENFLEGVHIIELILILQ
jgi:hypothetical protein